MEFTQTGSTGSARIQLYDSAGILSEAGTAVGTITAEGTLTLTGIAKSVDNHHPGRTTVRNWETALTADGREMTGRFIQERHFYNAWGLQHQQQDCEVVTLGR